LVQRSRIGRLQGGRLPRVATLHGFVIHWLLPLICFPPTPPLSSLCCSAASTSRLAVTRRSRACTRRPAS
jgi:hypothetical protein